MKLHYRWSVVLGYECHFNSLLTYITFLSIVQVFGSRSVWVFPAFFSPTHFLYSIHSRPNRSRVHFRFRTVLLEMVGKIQEIFQDYEKRLQEMPFIPRGSYGRRMVRQDGGPNRDFITYLFCDHGLAVQLLKDVGLIRCKVQCNTCDRDMTWCAYPTFSDGFRWRCRWVTHLHISCFRLVSSPNGSIPLRHLPHQTTSRI